MYILLKGTPFMKAPTTADEVQLTKHAKGFCKKIGKQANGNPKTFWLGHDEASAKVNAWELMKIWDNRHVGDRPCDNWDEIDALNADLEEQAVIAAPSPEKIAERIKVAEFIHKTAEVEHKRLFPDVGLKQGITIAEAKDHYLNAMRKRIGLIGSLGISSRTYDYIEYRVSRALEFVPPSITHMSELNYAQLETTIYALAARPAQKPNPFAAKAVQTKQKNTSISQATIIGIIQAFKAFLLWSFNEGVYVLPPHAANLWKIRPEAEEQKYRTITQDELKALWNGCINENARGNDKGERRRLWIMLGLNCGFYAVDIATLTQEHITDDGFIWKLRRKTRKTNTKLTRTKWKLWKETKELLIKYMPLKVTPNQIRLSWERLAKSTGIDVNHSNLRDTGSQFMEKIGGTELANTYTAHARKGVIDSYSHPDWDTLNNALNKFYTEFVKAAIS